MNAVPPHFTPASGPVPAGLEPGAGGTIAIRWAALADAAGLVAALAGLEPEPDTPAFAAFPAQIRDAEAWRRERAEQGIDDLIAIMKPGLAALLALNARSADPRPAALALSHEFAAARAAILSLLPPASAPAGAA